MSDKYNSRGQRRRMKRMTCKEKSKFRDNITKAIESQNDKREAKNVQS